MAKSSKKKVAKKAAPKKATKKAAPKKAAKKAAPGDFDYVFLMITNFFLLEILIVSFSKSRFYPEVSGQDILHWIPRYRDKSFYILHFQSHEFTN